MEGSKNELMDAAAVRRRVRRMFCRIWLVYLEVYFTSLPKRRRPEELTPGQIAYQRNLASFKSVLEHAARQIGGDVSLEIPEVDVSAPGILEDQTALGELEHAVEGWTTTIQQVVDQEAAKRPSASGPLAEVDFWRERHRALSALYEQLQLPRVQAILLTLKKVDAHAMIGYNTSYGELQN